MKKILITGASGQLGSELMKLFDDREFRVFGTYNTKKPKSFPRKKIFRLDLSKEQEIRDAIKSIRPDNIIHCAAMTNVDECEKYPNIAHNINAKSTEVISELAEELGSRMLYVSTDFVFDGLDGNYDESHETKPIQVYGKTKLRGEEAVRKMTEDSYCIVRTSVVFGPDPGNFVSWVTESLRLGKRIQIVDDQFVTPTYSVDLAEKISMLVTKSKNGFWNVACSNRLSRFEMAGIISNTLGVGSDSIKTAKMADMEWSAMRPTDSSLNTEKIDTEHSTISFEDCLERMYR